jgi:hypothetical protein
LIVRVPPTLETTILLDPIVFVEPEPEATNEVVVKAPVLGLKVNGVVVSSIKRPLFPAPLVFTKVGYTRVEALSKPITAFVAFVEVPERFAQVSVSVEGL